MQNVNGDEPTSIPETASSTTARQRLLMDGVDATSAAYEVGYESVSLSYREYSRMFSQPPTRDIKALRDANVVSIDAAEHLANPELHSSRFSKSASSPNAHRPMISTQVAE